MAKNDFDIDFDFEKEYGLDPKAVLDSDYNDEDLDFSEFANLGIDLTQEGEEDFSDFDVDDLDLEEDLDFSNVDLSEEYDYEEVPELPDEDALDAALKFSEDIPEPEDFADEDSMEEAEDDIRFSDEDFDDEDDFADEGDDLLDFSRRASFFGEPEAQQEEATVYEEVTYDQKQPYAPAYDEEEEEDVPEGFDDEMEDEEAEEDKPSRRRKNDKPREPIKLTMPPFLTKLWKLYFPPKEEWDPKPDPNNPRRRRKKSKQQIFKEVYLPPIIAGISLVLVVVFAVGSLRNFISVKSEEREQAKQESIAAEQAAAQIQSESQRILEEAERMAAGYDYQGAADLIASFNNGDLTNYPDLTQKKADYINIQSSMVEHKDPSTIPNLSFHVLIHDMARAMADDDDLKGQYNKNFVSTTEFTKILEQLYSNGYVLVDFDSFTGTSTGVDGSETYYSTSIFLPEGKKPVMITETMVNYFGYMIDSNDDWVADAGGDGFASKLVVQNGEIKAEYVDANGQTSVGNYDLVPILEDFIKQHPDFSYRGARATLAVCGMQGIFGYRTNTSFVSIPSLGNDFYEQECADAKVLVQALREKGYTLACYSYDNVSYTGKSATQVEADINNWKNQIVPIIGDVDVIVYARESDIPDYSGNVFKVLYNAGFRYFVRHTVKEPVTEVNTTYVRQSRLMVTGMNMFWYPERFTGMFDTNLVLESVRGDVPKN